MACFLQDVLPSPSESSTHGLGSPCYGRISGLTAATSIRAAAPAAGTGSHTQSQKSRSRSTSAARTRGSWFPRRCGGDVLRRLNDIRDQAQRFSPGFSIRNISGLPRAHRTFRLTLSSGGTSPADAAGDGQDARGNHAERGCPNEITPGMQRQ